MKQTKNHPHPDNNNWDETAIHSGQDARVTRGRDARDTMNGSSLNDCSERYRRIGGFGDGRKFYAEVQYTPLLKLVGSAHLPRMNFHLINRYK